MSKKEKEPSPPFSSRLAVLQRRLNYLQGLMRDEPEDTGRSYTIEEIGALEWAIEALEGRLTFPPDVEEMRRAWNERQRYNKMMDREFALFCEFLDWRQENAMREARRYA